MRSVVALLTTVFTWAFMASGLAVADSVRPADGSVSPPGANDWQCAPAAEHPRPVVLLHGTWGNQNTWDVLAPELVIHIVEQALDPSTPGITCEA
ncbi:hypothetical protein [Nocardia terpenica]|uniref:Lipase n=1 Tax=Nocardia terpenica TaxID=455432 RepID=A0A164JZ96_9NOCA|nr:hypothetical protein AWN90_40825 [Nocardia terpenica]NQE89826.1 hypothetical protein [Nocardia terpenica]